MQHFMGNPTVGLFSMLIIGALAGWIAERVNSANHGLFTNIFVGIGGAFIGRELAGLAGIHVNGFFATLIAAALGASLILFLWRKLNKQA